MIEKIGNDPFTEFNNQMSDKIELPPAAEIPQEVLNQQTAPEPQFGMNQPVPPIEYPAQQPVMPQTNNGYVPQSTMVPPANNGYVQQPMSGYTPQPNTGYVQQPVNGYVPQPNTGYMQHPINGYAPQPTTGYMQQPTVNNVPETFNIPNTGTQQPIVEQPTTTQTPIMEQPTVEQTATIEPPITQPIMEQPTAEQATTTQSPVVQPTVEQATTTQSPVEQSVVEQPPVTQPTVEQTATVEPIMTKLRKLNIEPTNVPQKNLSDCTLEELLKNISNVVSENCYEYINEMLGNNVSITKLSNNPSKAECAALMNTVPLNMSMEKWIEVEAELEKNKELYSEASKWVTSKIKENSSIPKYAMGRSDVVFGLYKQFYNSSETVAKDKAPTNGDTDTKTTPKKTRASKKKTAETKPAVTTDTSTVTPSTVEQPTVTQPVVEQNVTAQPTVETAPVTMQPTVEQPITAQPTVEQPATTQQTTETAPGQVNMSDMFDGLW